MSKKDGSIVSRVSPSESTITLLPIFELNDYYELLLSIKESDQHRFQNLSPATHLALSYYERAKHQACNEER